MSASSFFSFAQTCHQDTCGIQCQSIDWPFRFCSCSCYSSTFLETRVGPNATGPVQKTESGKACTVAVCTLSALEMMDDFCHLSGLRPNMLKLTERIYGHLGQVGALTITYCGRSLSSRSVIAHGVCFRRTTIHAT